MMQLLMVVPLAVVYLSTPSEASRCDEAIINTIREDFWNNCNCIPAEIKRTLTFLSPVLELYTTEDFYPKANEITCVYNQMGEDYINLFIRYENGTTRNEFYDVKFTEKDGVLIDEEIEVFRYYLYVNKLGVSAFYECSSRGEEGDPQGVIQASSRGYDDKALSQAVEDLTYLGLNVRDTAYSESCVE